VFAVTNATTPAPTAASRTAPAKGPTYVVAKGDVLSGIAARTLGSAGRWREIAALNPKVDPDRLFVGTVLALPADAADAKTAATTVATLSNTFDANHGGNKQTVVSSQEFNFPPTLPGNLPAPFTYVINFQNPYAFNGTNGGLCWEVQITQQTNLTTTVYLDQQYSQSANPQAETDTYGEGCIHSSRTAALGATCSTSFNWNNKTGTLYLNGTNLPINSLALGVIGFSRTNYGPFPLPWTFPGSANQYSGPCNLYTSLDILLPGGSSTSGTAQVSLPIPLDPATMNGLTLYGQYMSPDLLTKAAIKFTTSNGTIWNFVAPFTLTPGGYVLANTTFAATGTSMNKNYAYVTQLL
jgi:LysM repeat protein